MCSRAREAFKTIATVHHPQPCQNRPEMKGSLPAIAAVVLSATLAAQTATRPAPPRAAGERPSTPMNDISERYVKLVLALGQHDPDYVDAYYGPLEWRPQADAAKASLDELAGRARTLLEAIRKVPVPSAELESLRHH